MKKIYLAGPMLLTEDEGMLGWRKDAEKELNAFEILDPTVRDYRELTDEFMNEIVEGDKKDIETTDIVLANCWKPSAGTSMEIYFAWLLTKPVISVVEGRVSPWIRYHSLEVFSTVKQACEFINANFK